MSFDLELDNNISSFCLIRKVKGKENLQMRTDVIHFHVMQPMPSTEKKCTKKKKPAKSPL